jgi:hypothetical protein
MPLSGSARASHKETGLIRTGKIFAGNPVGGVYRAIRNITQLSTIADPTNNTKQ